MKPITFYFFSHYWGGGRRWSPSWAADTGEVPSQSWLACKTAQLSSLRRLQDPTTVGHSDPLNFPAPCNFYSFECIWDKVIWNVIFRGKSISTKNWVSVGFQINFGYSLTEPTVSRFQCIAFGSMAQIMAICGLQYHFPLSFPVQSESSFSSSDQFWYVSQQRKIHDSWTIRDPIVIARPSPATARI